MKTKGTRDKNETRTRSNSDSTINENDINKSNETDLDENQIDSNQIINSNRKNIKVSNENNSNANDDNCDDSTGNESSNELVAVENDEHKDNDGDDHDETTAYAGRRTRREKLLKEIRQSSPMLLPVVLVRNILATIMLIIVAIVFDRVSVFVAFCF